jgi:hypothetical protein
MVRYTCWIAPPGVNQANRSGDSRKVQMLPLDHPWRELDDLFRRERLLCDQLARDGIADAECRGGLLHGDSGKLFQRRACREALGMAQVLHGFLCPGAEEFRLERYGGRLHPRNRKLLR